MARSAKKPKSDLPDKNATLPLPKTVETIAKERAEELFPKTLEDYAKLRAKVARANLQLLDDESSGTIFYHGERSYSTCGVKPVEVSREQHNLLKSFLDRDEAIGTKKLREEGVSNVSIVVGKLIKIFGPEAISQPNRKGAGYFIRVRSLGKSQDDGWLAGG